MTRQNSTWADGRIQGELARLGYAIAASTEWEILHAARQVHDLPDGTTVKIGLS